MDTANWLTIIGMISTVTGFVYVAIQNLRKEFYKELDKMKRESNATNKEIKELIREMKEDLKEDMREIKSDIKGLENRNR